MSSILPKQIQIKSGDHVLLRTAAPDDAAALVAYCQAVTMSSEFLITEADEFDLTVEQEREWITRHRDSAGSLVLLAESDGAVIGLLNCECGSRRRIAHRSVLGISVRADFRSRGVGSALMQTLVDWARSNPTIDKLALAVMATNTQAIALYRRCGFVEEGRRINEVKVGPNRFVDDVLMYRMVNQSSGST